jgi:phospholipid N-methyltransferase
MMSAISRSLESVVGLGEHRFGIAFWPGMQEIPPTDMGPTPRAERRWQSSLLFIRKFFSHPRMLGSIIPSSRFLIRQLLSPVDWSRARVIVEYGPGVGVIIREILRKMRSDATLVVIELNPDFVDYLRSTLSDPRIMVIHGSAIDVEKALRQAGTTRADYVISGIPFSTMPALEREAALNNARAVLEPQGLFLVYQFSSSVLTDLRRIFRNVTRRFEPLNILPAHLYFCETGAGFDSGN